MTQLLQGELTFSDQPTSVTPEARVSLVSGVGTQVAGGGGRKEVEVKQVRCGYAEMTDGSEREMWCKMRGRDRGVETEMRECGRGDEAGTTGMVERR